jgi:hypothetical protein
LSGGCPLELLEPVDAAAGPRDRTALIERAPECEPAAHRSRARSVDLTNAEAAPSLQANRAATPVTAVAAPGRERRGRARTAPRSRAAPLIAAPRPSRSGGSARSRPLRPAYARERDLPRAIDVDRRSGRIRVRLDDFEREPARQVLEQGQAVAERRRMDHQPVLIDQPFAREGLGERRAAVRQQVTAFLRL